MNGSELLTRIPPRGTEYLTKPGRDSEMQSLASTNDANSNMKIAAGGMNGEAERTLWRARETAGANALKTYKKYTWWNGIAGVAHLVQGIVMLILTLTNTDVRYHSYTITRSFLVYNTTQQQLVPGVAIIGEYHIAVTSLIFLFVTAFVHLSIAGCPWVRKMYASYLEVGNNRIRWIEYGLTSTIMMTSIAVLAGVRDVGSLIGVAGCNYAMIMFGDVHEYINLLPRKKTKWCAFWTGSIIGAAPWAVVFITLYSSPSLVDTPWFVFAAFWAYLGCFVLFPIVVVYQTVSSFDNARNTSRYQSGEGWFIILSLFSKSALAWLVYAGTASP